MKMFTQMQAIFSSLIDKQFPPHDKLHQLFNWSNVKVSYNCTLNMKSIINANSRMILQLSPLLVGDLATASISKNLPWTKSISEWQSVKNKLYWGIISLAKVYYGICETIFKLRYTNDKKSFNHGNSVQILSYLTYSGK